MSEETNRHNAKVEQLRMLGIEMLQAALAEFQDGKYLSAKMRVQMVEAALAGLRRLSGDTE
jgi:hypothetical protein